MKSMTEWQQITTEEAYRLNQAEFKGMTIQALQDIREDIRSIQADQQARSLITFGISSFIAAISGAIGGWASAIMKGKSL